MAEGVAQGLVPVPGGPGEAIRTAGVAPGGGVLADGGVDSAVHRRGRRTRGSRASKGSQVITDGGTPLRLFVFARHAESAANVGHVLSTDPSRPVALTERGRAQARALGAQLANVPIDLAVSSRLLRTRETISIALDGRAVPVLTEPGLDEIRAGDLDGQPIQAYWDWLGHHTATDRLPHGESVDDALRRYGGALRRLLARAGSVTLVVTHELALRHVAGAAAPGRPPRPGTDFPTPSRTSSTTAPSGVPPPAWPTRSRRPTQGSASHETCDADSSSQGATWRRGKRKHEEDVVPEDLMRALHVPGVGERPQLSDLPVPEPGEGQVLIRVMAAALNGIDNGIADGMMAEMIEHAYPLVLGRDAAGVVEEAGPGIEGIFVGDEVFGHALLTPQVQAGTLAEYALLPAGGTAPKPAGLDWVTAAALPLAGAAATAAVNAVDPQPGRVVLVVGAARRSRLVRDPDARRARRHRPGHRHRGRHRTAEVPGRGHRGRRHDRPGR